MIGPSRCGNPARSAIVGFSVRLGADPDKVSPGDVRALKEAGLTELEILDLIHSVALFAWANRLMLNLGEPVFPEIAATPAS